MRIACFQTVGDDNTDGKENFFKATTLASYITLNDNLRFYEEQQRKKTVYSFGLTGKREVRTALGWGEGTSLTLNLCSYEFRNFVNLHLQGTKFQPVEACRAT